MPGHEKIDYCKIIRDDPKKILFCKIRRDDPKKKNPIIVRWKKISTVVRKEDEEKRGHKKFYYNKMVLFLN